MTELTDKAKSICTTYYRTRCGQCPIRSACVHPVKPTQDGIDRWVENVNEAAERQDGPYDH